MTTPLPSVRVAWRPEQFNRVTNPGFETNTTGWAVTAGINAAGTSVTRGTTDFHSGAASATVVCTATDGSGVNFDMGANRFYGEASYGAMYVAVVWLKRVSGSRRARLILGSEGTTDDRGTLTITDLTDQWQPYSVRWLPAANRTDVQLAVTNGSAEALTFLIDDAAVYLVDGFTQVENGSFEVDTTGWTVGAGNFAAAATSITRTAGGFGGSWCGRVVTSAASATSGTTYSLSGRTFTSGRTYRLRVGIKSVSGSTAAALQWGSPAGADSQTDTVTLTTSFAWYTSDWTPSADRTDVELCIRNTTAATRTFDIDEVEVYEAVDDLGTDAGDLTWSRSLDSVGTATVQLLNTSGDYDPRNASSPLYGFVAPGKRLWIRSLDSTTLRGEFCGTIVTVEPRPWDGAVDLVCEDMMGFLRDARTVFDFDQTDEYWYARKAALTSALWADPDVVPYQLSSSRVNLSTYSIESVLFFNASDGEVPVLDYLADLNDATQSVHWCEPSPHAMIGWRYTTQDRATFTDSSSDLTVDETDPPEAFDGVRLTHETLENRVEVDWQGYEKLPPSDADNDGFGDVARGYDPSVYGDLGQGDDAPYIAYTDDSYGTDDNHPEARWRYPGGRKRWKARKKRGLKVKRRTRVYPRAVIPLAMAAGDVRRFVFDFSIPVSGLLFYWSSTTNPDNFIADYVEGRPNRLVVDLRCLTADTIDYIGVAGTPWEPLDELTEVTEAFDSQLVSGVRNGDRIDSAYVPARGMAQGVGAYRTWRFGTGRMRPTMVDRNNRYTADLGDHVTVTLDRWRVSSVLFAITGSRWEVTRGGLDWRSWHELEELPTHTDWFTLDDATKGLDDAVVLAY